MRPGSRPQFLTISVAVVTLGVSACTFGDDSTGLPGEVKAVDIVVEEPAVEPGSTSVLVWDRCGDLECTTVTVPLDHRDPDGPSFPLAVARHAAEGERIGSLVLNPGGPGASGVEYLEFFSQIAPSRLRDRFDLVSFDPRGVARSGSIDCGWVIDDDTFDPDVASDDLEQRVAASIAEARADAESCRRRAGELLPYVSTTATARDLDLVRTALADDQISYLGFSYGTLIGAVYAELFPTRVRAMVLDGADQLRPSHDDILAQYRSFEAAFDAFAEGCGRREQCPLNPGEADVIVATIDDGLRAEALDAGDGRILTRDELPVALLRSLYDQNSWTSLAAGLSLAADGDGTILQSLVDDYAQRRDDGTYSDIFESFTAISCADDAFRPTPDQVLDLARRAANELDVFASVAGDIGVGCTGWTAPIDPLPRITGTGAAPILVIGTTGDPATPYEWAVQMADTLESGVLVTYEGVVHTAFNTSDCVRALVVDYLTELRLPNREVCTD